MARSGWMKPVEPTRPSDHVSLGVLAKVFPPSLVNEVVTKVGAGEQRSRLLPAWMMVYYVMALALHAAASYEEVMRNLLGGLQWISHRTSEWSMPTKAAIFKARTRLGAPVMIELFDQAAKPFGLQTPRGFLAGLRLVSVDGTTMDLADTPANERAYGRPGTNTEFKSAFPQARLLGLVECSTHAIIGAVTGPCTTAENDMYPGLHHKLDSSMLLMADRGFFSYRSFKDSAATGAQLLWRVRGNMVLPVHEEFEDGSYLSAVYEGTKERRNNVDPIRVRVVEYAVGDGEKTSEFRLLTTILDPGIASARELAEAYAKRWEIELCFKEMKTHQRGPSVVLRSKTPEGVLQEIYGYLCAHYALRTLIGEVAAEFDEDPLRISFTRTLRAARRSMATRPGFYP
ncbi:IS4-like element ISAar21 family transposase [Glutamicibacter arilaitensis]|uniref:IS4-like element ISAar21 family transposase n=2 Tax=Glutamicibacter arilaitensis TaxID=256701 RepID=UPI001868BF0C|nr:IS4-like element ISAar21 family transposase [Glutamicibacter arilaitensis]